VSGAVGLVGRERIQADLDEQLCFAEADLAALAGSALFITGGTGFVGAWLLESLIHANTRLRSRITATVLTRDPRLFLKRHPNLAENAAIRLIEGDVRALPESVPHFDAIIHAATPASAALNRERPFEMMDTVIEGGRRVVELAMRSGAIPLLFTSSGAVYGVQPATILRTPEAYLGGPDPLSPLSAYGESKRIGEFQCAIAARRAGVRAKIARLFAFVGPYLPTDRHLAAGNFLADAHAGRSISVAGDGTTIRSYQYAAEMTTWLWAVLVRGESLRPYNVGSEEAVSIAELASLAARSVSPEMPVTIHGRPDPARPLDRYVPSTERIRDELGVVTSVALADGLRRTLSSMGT
jgi:nucleoside-diphosphate-sugar epimerase